MENNNYFFIKDPLLKKEYFSLEEKIASKYPKLLKEEKTNDDSNKKWLWLSLSFIFIIIFSFLILGRSS